MRRSHTLTAVLALAITSSVAFALAPMVANWSGTITANNGGKITGDASMKPTADGTGTEVNVMLMGDAASVTRPWHVHIGSCAKGGGVFGGGKSYTPIATDASGHGMTKAILAVPTPDTGSYYVNIHESAGNMGKIVACGDLTKKM